MAMGIKKFDQGVYTGTISILKFKTHLEHASQLYLNKRQISRRNSRVTGPIFSLIFSKSNTSTQPYKQVTMHTVKFDILARVKLALLPKN